MMMMLLLMMMMIVVVVVAAAVVVVFSHLILQSFVRPRSTTRFCDLDKQLHRKIVYNIWHKHGSHRAQRNPVLFLVLSKQKI